MGLSPEEERHIRNLSLIPFALVFYVCLGYFVYLIHVNATLSLFFVVGYFTFIFLFVFPVIYFSTEQLLRSRREKKPFAFYVKRFVGEVSIFAFGGAILGVTWIVLNLSISSLVDFSTLLIVTLATFFVIWGFIAFRFREKFKSISEGNW